MQTEVLEPKELTPATLYPEVHEELAKLAAENDKAVFDYEDAKQNKLARSHVYSLRGYKSAVEKRRKELKADALAYGRKVDGAAKEITAQIEDMIAVHQEPLDRIEQREKDRVAAIQEAIDKIAAYRESIQETERGSGWYRATIEKLEAVKIDGKVFQERMAEADELKRLILIDLRDAETSVAEQERKDAELARLRAEAEERERKDREEQIAREAAAEAQRIAEAKAQAEREEAARRERDAIERAERAEQEKVEAAKKAEADRIAAEQRAEQARLDAIEQTKREQREAEAERERQAEAKRIADEQRAANAKHRAKVLREAVIGIEDAVPIADDIAEQIIEAIADGKVPHVSIQF